MKLFSVLVGTALLSAIGWLSVLILSVPIWFAITLTVPFTFLVGVVTLAISFAAGIQLFLSLTAKRLVKDAKADLKDFQDKHADRAHDDTNKEGEKE